MKQKQRIAFLGMVALAMILVACGGDSGNNSSESEGDSSSSGGASSSSSPVVSSSSATLLSSSSSIEYGTLIYEGQTYKTVNIGTQTWMAENLNYAVDSSWCYNNSADNCVKYGRLYQWASAMKIASTYNSTIWGGSDVNHQGICPEDWHLPNNDEWETLYDYVVVNNDTEKVGTSLKSTSGWKASSGVVTGTDRFGFSALPAGYRDNYGDFSGAGNGTYFWSATEGSSYNANWATTTKASTATAATIRATGSVFAASRIDSQSNARICGRACLPFGLALRVKSKMTPLFFEYEPFCPRSLAKLERRTAALPGAHRPSSLSAEAQVFVFLAWFDAKASLAALSHIDK